MVYECGVLFFSSQIWANPVAYARMLPHTFRLLVSAARFDAPESWRVHSQTSLKPLKFSLLWHLNLSSFTDSPKFLEDKGAALLTVITLANQKDSDVCKG